MNSNSSRAHFICTYENRDIERMKITSIEICLIIGCMDGRNDKLKPICSPFFSKLWARDIEQIKKASTTICLISGRQLAVVK